ncbi:MAG: hypothetical protein GY757_51170 [bacterium]|nr:hypothetical protein [bacterium]
MKQDKFTMVGLILIFVFFSSTLGAGKTVTEESWPRRVLITNDNGIEDIKIVELARAFSKVAETYVVAPKTDRSGSGNFISLGSRKPVVTVEKRDLGPGITAYALDGYPADCVYWGFRGLLKDNPPDLLVSGINGGPNLGYQWFNSGTVGAARTAAFTGMPAIAVSGLDKRFPRQVEAAVQWVVRLAGSPVVKNLGNGQYLTVSIPRVPPDKIKGIKIVPRAGLPVSTLPFFTPAEGNEKNKDLRPGETWVLNAPAGRLIAEKDVAAYGQNYIVVVPMKVMEVDETLMQILRNKKDALPSWQPQPVHKENRKGDR